MNSISSHNSAKFRFWFILLFVGGFIHSTLLAQNVVTPQHIAEMETVTNSLISPDGQFIAYTVSTPANPYKENSANSTHLYLLNISEGTTTPYHTSSSVSSVQFRPGQETITFLTKMANDETRSLYQVPVNGGEAVKIFSFEQDIISYTWHTDGNRIAFMAKEDEEESTSPLPYQADVYEENVPHQRGYIANLTMSGQMARRLPIDGSIYTMEWSPNGQRLALVAASNVNDPNAGRVLIVSARGGVPQIVNREFEGAYEQIKWKEENFIHFLASESTASRLGKLRFDGGEEQTLFFSDEHDISSFSVSDSSSYSFVASAPEYPSEVFYFSGEENDMHERMTYHNEWLNSVDLGRQVVVSYQTRDGQYTIDGILIYPVGYEDGTGVPVITQVHGGPESHYDNGWLTSYSSAGQMAAGKGYAVFYPNYRGSTGRGIDFAFSSQAGLAGAEFDDIVDGVDYLIETGIADPDRVGVTGGSYGGYASAWMSTYYSNRFAASVMFVGISDNISMWGESDIPEELYLVHARKRIWNNWNWFLERSPIYRVESAQTPILIMHGAEDTRVHPSQSLELYRHLKVRKPNLPVRLVYYPGEGHGNSRASSKLDYSYRMLQWFDTYLMTGDATAEKPPWEAPIPEEE